MTLIITTKRERDETLFFSYYTIDGNYRSASELSDGERDDNRSISWAERQSRFLACVCDDSPG